MSSTNGTKGEQAAFGGLIGSIIVTIILPFLQHYSVVYYDLSPTSPTQKSHIETFTITIHNIGLVAANNIVAQFNSSHFRIINFTSMPFLSKNFNTKNTANGFFNLSFIPPQGEVAVKGKINTSGIKPNETLPPPYVQSKEGRIYSYNQFVYDVFVFIIASAALMGCFAVIWNKYTSPNVKELLRYLFPSKT